MTGDREKSDYPGFESHGVELRIESGAARKPRPASHSHRVTPLPGA
jgi:hypothetical protein